MGKYILFLEDEVSDREFYQKEACRRDFTAQGIGALDELEHYLTTYPAENRASYYVLDGCFPRTQGDRITCLVDEAISLIREAKLDAFILIYSSSSEAEQMARKAGVGFLHKLEGMDTLFARIEEGTR